MKKISITLATVLMAVMMAWIIASWVNVMCHNDPFDDDGDCPGWNLFVVMEELVN